MTPLTRPMLAALGTPADVLDGAVGYCTVVLAFMPVLVVFLLATQLVRGVGDTVTPLKALTVSTTRASSRMALAPFSKSTPACAATPRTSTLKSPVPLRAVL